MIEAFIRFSHLTATGQMFEMEALGVREVSKSPATGLCRKLLALHPELGDEKVIVHDKEGAIRYTINSVKDCAGLSYSEGDKGITRSAWTPMPENIYNLRESE